MKIGMIGAGRVSQAFARYLLQTGHEVLLSNSRGPASLSGIIGNLGPEASAVSVQEAAQAPIVALAVPWLKIDAALTGLPAWGGRILLDTTNPFVDHGELLDLGGQVASELVARRAPGARVVKALNSLLMDNFERGPQVGTGRRITFVSGDDAAAKAQVGTLLTQIGFAVIDLGSLHEGGRIQQAGGPLAGLDLAQMIE